MKTGTQGDPIDDEIFFYSCSHFESPFSYSRLLNQRISRTTSARAVPDEQLKLK